MNISHIHAWWILDSRGNPTVCCSITDDQGNTARGYVPSGASTGTHEALELRDETKDFGGKGVQKAIQNINTIITSQLLNTSSLANAEALLLSLDTTENKSHLGANAVLAVSMALHRLSAQQKHLYLAEVLSQEYFDSSLTFPRLMCNVINGGVHSDAGLSIQEFMLVPNTGSILSDIQAASEIYHLLKKQLAQKGQIVAVGDEGGFAPKISTTQEVLDTLISAIRISGYEGKCDIALDCAATEFFNQQSGFYEVDGRSLNSDELVSWYEELVTHYPIISIEDGFGEDDNEGWKKLTQRLGEKIMLVGDDLFVTNTNRIQSINIENNIANALLVKPNQIGSISETIKAIHLAQDHNMTTIISHRSGETEDSFIADLAVASKSQFIKLGAPARSDRTAKYNRLIELYHNCKK